MTRFWNLIAIFSFFENIISISFFLLFLTTSIALAVLGITLMMKMMSGHFFKKVCIISKKLAGARSGPCNRSYCEAGI